MNMVMLSVFFCSVDRDFSESFLMGLQRAAWIGYNTKTQENQYAFTVETKKPNKLLPAVSVPTWAVPQFDSNLNWLGGNHTPYVLHNFNYEEKEGGQQKQHGIQSMSVVTCSSTFTAFISCCCAACPIFSALTSAAILASAVHSMSVLSLAHSIMDHISSSACLHWKCRHCLLSLWS